MAHVLLIDDDQAIGEVMTTVIEDMGHSILTISTLSQISQSKKLSADLVLLDVNFGSASSTEVIQKIKRIPTLSTTPIFLFSADQDLESMAQKLPVAGILKKPFEIYELSKIIDTYCA